MPPVRQIDRPSPWPQRVVMALWGSLLLGILAWWWWHPEAFRVESVAAFIEKYCSSLWLGFVLISLLRGFLLIPNTPIVLAGAMLFPTAPFWVIGISLVGILFSGSVMYQLHRFTGMRAYVESRHPKAFATWSRRLRNRGGFLFTLGWSLFPFVPTDLLCFAAGVVGIRYPYLFAGVLLGELILVSCLVLTGLELANWIM